MVEVLVAEVAATLHMNSPTNKEQQTKPQEPHGNHESKS
jgi:hypothetical protein